MQDYESSPPPPPFPPPAPNLPSRANPVKTKECAEHPADISPNAVWNTVKCKGCGSQSMDETITISCDSEGYVAPPTPAVIPTPAPLMLPIATMSPVGDDDLQRLDVAAALTRGFGGGRAGGGQIMLPYLLSVVVATAILTVGR